jgi:hypothetical protein
MIKIITPIIYSYKKYLVYVLEIPLILPIEYQLYKLTPFPVAINKESSYGYINIDKEIIFSETLQNHYGKMNVNELMKCFQPNQKVYLCKAEIPIKNYIPGMDCEATLLQPSTLEVPKICEYRFFKLLKTIWIPLHTNKQWLFVAPRVEFLLFYAQKELQL